MTRKNLYLLIFIAILCFNLSGLADAAVAPVSTPLGYNTLPGGAPARIATDSIGKLYITDSRNNLLRVYSNNGAPLFTIKVNKPLGIAVDQSGKIFVGSRTDGSVSAFNSKGEFLYKLGSGNKEFGLPSDIAISSSGTIYITDSWQNRVNAYTTAGAPSFSITGLNFPTGIAVDDAAGEVYVSDHNNGMVKIFDMKGVYKRYIKGSGTWSSVFTRPQGLAIDSTRLYIADAYNSAIVVYGKDGKFLKYMGNYGAGAGEYKTPLDIAIDKDNKIFVTNYNNGRVEVIGIDSYSQLNINPNTLNFSVFENGLPITQTVNLTSTNATGWVASSSNSWVTVSPSEGTAPADADITVNPAGFGAGNYTAQVMFSTVSGTSAIVLVNLEVKPNSKTLYVAPTSMSFKYQLESPDLPSGNIVIASTGGSLSWAASVSAPWIGLGSISGLTPSNIKLSITDAVNALSPGTYDAKVIIDGGSAQGSPATINVSLRLIYAGTVKVVTNLEQAGFDITPIGIGTSYSGTGTEWSYDEAAPGDYTISFKHISGYLKPPAMTFTVKTGKEVTINGEYRVKPAATHIIAGSGGTKGKAVTALALNGEPVATFEPFKGPVSVRVAAGDFDGSGIDRIAVTDHKKSIKVYTFEGKELASLEMAEWYAKSEIAAADIDNDGKSEIIVGAKNDYDAMNIQREIKLLKYDNGKIEEKGTLYTESKDKEFTIALADINGDGIIEFIMADKNSVRAFKIDLSAEESKLSQLWEVKGDYKETPEIAAGDIDDDGISEIALSIEIEGEKGGKGQKGQNKSVIKMLKGTGEDYGMAIDAYGDLGYEKPSTVALGDIDGDGKDEIIAGAGRDEHNEPLIRMFESDGTFTGITIKAMESKGKDLFGVNVGLGRFK